MSVIRSALALLLLVCAAAAHGQLTRTGTIIDDDTGADDGLGNLWVDTNGGTCARQSSPGTYVDANACSSLNTAYAAAQCNDVIRVKGGSYSSVTVNETALGTGCGNSNRIIFRAAVGATSRPCGMDTKLGLRAALMVEDVQIPWIGNGTFGGTSSPDNVTYIGFATRLGISLYGDSNNATVDCFAGGSFIVGSSGSADDSTNVAILDSEWGPCGSRSIVGECSHSGDDSCNSGSGTMCGTGRNHIEGNSGGHMADGVLIEGNIIHEYPIENGADHWECVFVDAGRNVTIERNWIYDCETSGIAMPDTEAEGTWLVQNNWFGRVSSGNAAFKYGLLGGCPPGTHLIRFNSFAPGSSAGDEEGGGPCSSIHVIGNIMGENYGCGMASTWRNNLFLNAAGCHASDTNLGAGPLPYVDDDDLAAADYHLNGASTADGYVPASVTNSGVADDIDGDARSDPRDAGADEH